MIAIVGLGNPGKNYDKTIHNLGYMAIDYFAKNHSLNFTKSKYFGVVAEGMVGDEKVILLKPETFMNLSGKSVEDLVHKLKLDLTNIIVLSDDIDLDFGAIRIRSKGSAGTHNGLRDIVQKLGENFARIRIGAGRPEFGDLASYVLSKISEERLSILNNTFDKIGKALEIFIKNKKVEGIDINKL